MSIRFFRNLIAAVMMGVPTFEEKQVGRHDDLKPEEQIKPSKMATSGTVEQVNKYYGVTVAGGPGSQNIYKTFEALPEHIRQQMIDARKGKVRYPTRAEIAAALNDTPEGGYRPNRSMERGIHEAINRTYGNTPEKRLEGIKKVDAELAAQRAASASGKLEDYEPPKKEES